MRRFGLGLLLAGLPAIAAAGVPPDFVSTHLDNGLRVTILPDPHSPLVATQVWYGVGSAHEQPDRRGLAHLFEHLMFGAAGDGDSGEYERWHHDHGGYENAYTTPDETVYVSQIAPEAHRRVLELEARRMRGLRLDAAVLENEKRVVIEELRLATENDPLARLGVRALQELLAGHPYAVTPVGTVEDIEAADVEACREFYERYYRPGNAHLVIVGPVQPQPTLVAVRELFGPLAPGGVAPPEVPVLVGREFPEELVLRDRIPPVEVAIVGFALPPADDPDRAAVELLAELLAGSAVDPLREYLVVERGKAVEAGIEWLDFRRAGALVLYAAHVPYRRRATAFEWMERSLEGLGRLEWLDDERLEGARRRLLRERRDDVRFTDRRAAALGRAAAWQGDPRRLFERGAAIRAVTREDVARVFRRYVTDAPRARIYVRPERVPLWIRLFGWLYPMVS